MSCMSGSPNLNSFRDRGACCQTSGKLVFKSSVQWLLSCQCLFCFIVLSYMISLLFNSVQKHCIRGNGLGTRLSLNFNHNHLSSSLSLSLSLSIYLSMSLSPYLSLSIYIYIYMCVCVCVCVGLCVCACVRLCNKSRVLIEFILP